MKVIWKNIDGYNGDYKVSNKGEIISLKRNGQKLLRQNERSKDSYLCVDLCKNGKSVTRNVHNIVAETFLMKSDGLIVNHINENKKDNRIDNLEYVTHSENINHGTANKCRSETLSNYFKHDYWKIK